MRLLKWLKYWLWDGWKPITWEEIDRRVAAIRAEREANARRLLGEVE